MTLYTTDSYYSDNTSWTGAGTYKIQWQQPQWATTIGFPIATNSPLPSPAPPTDEIEWLRSRVREITELVDA